MKIAIVGSRDYKDLHKVVQYIESLPSDTEIVSGGARGVDTVAEQTANRVGLKCTVFHADWKRYGKRAGMIRNHTIRQYVDKVVAFHDGKSKGTQNMIDKSILMNVPLIVIPEE